MLLTSRSPWDETDGGLPKLRLEVALWRLLNLSFRGAGVYGVMGYFVGVRLFDCFPVNRTNCLRLLLSCLLVYDLLESMQ